MRDSELYLVGPGELVARLVFSENDKGSERRLRGP